MQLGFSFDCLHVRRIDILLRTAANAALAVLGLSLSQVSKLAKFFRDVLAKYRDRCR